MSGSGALTKTRLFTLINAAPSERSEDSAAKLALQTAQTTLLGVSTDEPGLRHAAQLAGAPAELRELDIVARTFTMHSDTPRCRFNLLVALEWVPSVETLAALKTALIEASRLLFDVTDGFMAIGQVLVGGTELLNCADIQIFASNRLFPRSSVDAMHDPTKYRPIRVGRGLWDKNNRTSIAWSTRAGYATLVHELGHHALGLKDQYLSLQTNGLVVPQHSLVQDTIMADLASSELLAPRANRSDGDPASEWEALRQHPQFARLGIRQDHIRSLRPPTAPLPEITCFMTPAVEGAQAEPLLVLDPVAVAAGEKALDLGHCWIYLLRMGKDNLPTRLIPQGSFEVRPDGFRLLGAQVGDRVLLCGSERDNPAAPLNLWATITGVAENTALLDDWQDATPAEWPQVSVTTSSVGPTGPYRVQLAEPVAMGRELTFPLGAQEPVELGREAELDLLDGHVLLITEQPSWRVALASYSLGGSTASGYPAHPNPIPAGSPDGNAMLFFYDAAATLDYTPTGRSRSSAERPERFLFVTTTNHHAPTLASPPPDTEPRSYVFSVAGNLPMGELARYSPTLVLYYDQSSRDSHADQLAIFRYDDRAGWVELSECDDKRERFLVAAPLNSENAPGLFQETPAPVRFRLLLKRKPQAS